LKVIVLAASDRGDKKLLSQLAVLNEFKSETYIYVLASSHILRRDGYYMDKSSSKRFLEEKGFRLVFYDKRGAVVTESTSVINGKSLPTF